MEAGKLCWRPASCAGRQSVAAGLVCALGLTECAHRIGPQVGERTVLHTGSQVLFCSSPRKFAVCGLIKRHRMQPHYLIKGAGLVLCTSRNVKERLRSCGSLSWPLGLPWSAVPQSGLLPWSAAATQLLLKQAGKRCAGLSHLLEYMAFKTTKHRTHFRVVREVSPERCCLAARGAMLLQAQA